VGKLRVFGAMAIGGAADGQSVCRAMTTLASL
jgi:hypothetical protein